MNRKKILTFTFIIITIILSVFLACDKKPTAPEYNNPFDPENPVTGGDPFHLTAVIANGGITLNWTKPVIDDLQNFKIYRSEQENTGFNLIQTTHAVTVQHIDFFVQNGHNYYYYVTAFNKEGQETSHTNTAAVNIKTTPLLVINSDDAYTPARGVNLTILANTAQQMMIANDAAFSGAIWETYATSKTWTLPVGEGPKTVYMKVKYAGEIESGNVHDDIILDTTPPTIVLTVSPDSGITNETTFQFDPTASYDNLTPTSDLRVQYDWENDGTFDTDWMPLSVSNYQYTIGGGNKTMKMLLTDGAWSVDTTINIFVNTRPAASFTATQDGSNSYLFHFNASASSDYEDGTNLEYRWDFNGNGNWTAYSSNATIDYTYSAFGNYTPKISVRDQNNLVSETSLSILTVPLCIDKDGNSYRVVQIGSQWWMAENLKVTTYQNGTTIPLVTDAGTWAGLSSGARCSYGINEDNIATYGLLFNWYAVADARDIAPAGWHVPSDEEWKTLEKALGMSQTDADASGDRGTDEGGKLKETGTTHWNSPNNGATNSSGFTALPGGYRGSDGAFYVMGYYGGWWSSTEGSSADAWYRRLSYYSSDVYRSYGSKQSGFSVRCVRD
ncbi:MAG: hypothetical protein JXR46_12440 [Calditrichaceae bacterium]|nr:hypothetical protein [Calditrichaceae bacterium]